MKFLWPILVFFAISLGSITAYDARFDENMCEARQQEAARKAKEQEAASRARNQEKARIKLEQQQTAQRLQANLNYLRSIPGNTHHLFNDGDGKGFSDEQLYSGQNVMPSPYEIQSYCNYVKEYQAAFFRILKNRSKSFSSIQEFEAFLVSVPGYSINYGNYIMRFGSSMIDQGVVKIIQHPAANIQQPVTSEASYVEEKKVDGFWRNVNKWYLNIIKFFVQKDTDVNAKAKDERTPMTNDDQQSQDTGSWPKLKMNGIAKSGGRNIVIINGKLVGVGDEVNGVIVTEIKGNSVKMKKGLEIREFRVGQK